MFIPQFRSSVNILLLGDAIRGRFSFTMDIDIFYLTSCYIGSMPRPPRLLLSRSYYHIMTRGNNKNFVFKKDDDYRYYLDLMSKYKNELPFDLFHYCLMPSHVHMLMKTQKAHSFSLFMKKINLAYFHYYKRKYRWVGHFWQDRFKSQPVGKDEYFIQCGKYIELNPVRKGLVVNPEEYRYSSYRFYVLGDKNILLTEDIFYEGLGKNQKDRQESYEKLIVGDLVVSSYLRRVWGSIHQRDNETRKIQHHFG